MMTTRHMIELPLCEHDVRPTMEIDWVQTGGPPGVQYVEPGQSSLSYPKPCPTPKECAHRGHMIMMTNERNPK